MHTNEDRRNINRTPRLTCVADRAHLTAFIALLLVAPQLSFLQAARAEEPAQPRLANAGDFLQPCFSLALRYSDDLLLGTEGGHAIQRAEIPAPPVPRECKPRYMAGPAVGIPLGLGTAAFGSVFTYAATVDVLVPTPNSRGGIAGGTLMIAAGLATFIYSSIKLKRNMDARRRLCSSIVGPHRQAGDERTGAPL